MDLVCCPGTFTLTVSADTWFILWILWFWCYLNCLKAKGRGYSEPLSPYWERLRELTRNSRCLSCPAHPSRQMSAWEEGDQGQDWMSKRKGQPALGLSLQKKEHNSGLV